MFVMVAPLLELKNVGFRINGKRVLQRVSWRIAAGEHWAVLGPNGAGKTTLLKMICGFLWPNDGGRVYRNGDDLIDLGELRRSIGWVTSILAADIPRGEKVIETVVSGKYAQLGLWALPNEHPGPVETEKARACLAEFKCDHLADRTFGTLSQGEQQKVLICRSLMARPYLLILDEACAGLDPGAREIVLSALFSLGRKKTLPALVYVTHHPEEILPIFTNTLAIKEGKVMASGPTRDILTAGTIKDLYGLPVKLIHRKGRYWPVPG